MKKPPRRLVKSVFDGSFNDNSDLPRHRLEFTLKYNHLSADGHFNVRFPFGQISDLAVQLAMAACGMNYGTYFPSGEVESYSAGITPKLSMDGDVRVQGILRTFLTALRVDIHSPCLQVKVIREYEVRVPGPGGRTGMRWISEGQLARESIAAVI